ncbi:AI-2E family transporter [Flavobacterium salilacus subsp. salilacus]|uniref:AI-2E family transporter n=1 Tax=Flavobacterium TaxID=237 RepID=UPI00107534CB|nr:MULTISPECIES: AI-2E family transporter [Flavobacterium]KAF2518875.1 AI-2E family transporter [Flavobacterium salilacus subsp. salilacus]MBE1614965.1 AI-2E family transporter [Flavobacterium sp. SaA2.13]
MDTVKLPSYIKAVFISLLIIIIVFFMIVAKTILVPLFVSGFISMLLTSACNRLERRKVPRTISAAICLLIFMVIISASLIFIYFQVRSFVEDLGGDLSEKVNSYVIDANNWSYENLGIDMGMYNGFEFKKAVAIVQTEDATPTQLIFSTLSTLSDILLLPVFIFFLLIYRDHLAVFISKVFRRQNDSDLLEKLTSIRRIVYNYISGAGKVMMILAIINTAVLFALGIEHAIFFGVLAGMLNIIPYLGPVLGAVLPFFFALITKDNLFYPIAVIISFTFIQLLENAYLTPKITGSNVNLNAFVTFLGLLIGAAIWGIVGMILIIPTIAILKRLFEMNPETEPYAYLFGEEDSNWFKKRSRKRELPKPEEPI